MGEGVAVVGGVAHGGEEEEKEEAEMRAAAIEEERAKEDEAGRQAALQEEEKEEEERPAAGGPATAAEATPPPTGHIAWDMEDREGEAVHPSTAEEEQYRDYEGEHKDISPETYEAEMYPRESKEDQGLEREEKEKEREEAEEEAAEAEEYPKYLVDPKSVKEGYDFEGVLKKEEEQVEEQKKAQEEEETHLQAEKAKLDEEKRALRARMQGEALPDTVGGRIAANERRLWNARQDAGEGGVSGGEGGPVQGGMEGEVGEEGQAVEGTEDGGAPLASASREGAQEDAEEAMGQEAGEGNAEGEEEEAQEEEKGGEEPDPSKPYQAPPPHEFDTPATGQKEPPEFDESREYYDDQNKDDPNGLWGDWRQVRQSSIDLLLISFILHHACDYRYYYIINRWCIDLLGKTI